MKKLISIFITVIMLVTFLVAAPFSAFAGYKKFTGTYKGTWSSYNMSCLDVYSTSSGSSTLKMKVKKNGKFTGTLKFGKVSYAISGRIKNKNKIRVHYNDFSTKYDYKGTIRKKKINMNAYNDDSLTDNLCPTGWRQRMKLAKV